MWIKICGMTTDDAVDAALRAQVDAIGFVFAESKRRVTPQRATELARPANGKVLRIAVTKHPTQTEVDDILATFKPDVLQTDITDLARLRLPETLEVLPVIRAGSSAPTPLPARFLFEGPVSGTGVPTDWSVARLLTSRAQLVLAGGLSPDNISAAIQAAAPFGVDVSSGVESTPGLKSPDKIARFVSAARAKENAP